MGTPLGPKYMPYTCMDPLGSGPEEGRPPAHTASQPRWQAPRWTLQV